MYIGDLHIHSRYSRATSRDCTPEYLELWARKKGIDILGTGDFTHPAWREELSEKLEPAEEGLYVLKEEYRIRDQETPDDRKPRFVVTGEISSIYKKMDRVRKVHSLLLLPGLEEAEKLSRRLELIGNIHSDGRPILGLDCRDLLEIMLETCPHGVYVPAHIWTPHFSLFGAFSGFDRIEDCYGDLTGHIHALETGLSSDPPMNWRVSALDRYHLISNSDAHSPAKLGREANLFDIELSFQGLSRALSQGEGLCGTIEFFPEEGKYHFDGHRKCSFCLDPKDAARYGNICPVCNKKLTIGVLHRVEELADRPEGYVDGTAPAFESLVPLPEVIAASTGMSAAGKKVQEKYNQMLKQLGPEFSILRQVPAEDIQKVSGPLIAEGIRRLREGRVERVPGFDGEYGKIRLLDEADISALQGQLSFFTPEEQKELKKSRAKENDRKKTEFSAALSELDLLKPSDQESVSQNNGAAGLPLLNPQQEEAVRAAGRSVAVIAGPGAGKTKTLISRLVYLLEERKIPPSEITAVTFTNKAAQELGGRLEKLPGGKRFAKKMRVGTFHSICSGLLTERGTEFCIADEGMQEELSEQTKKKFGLELTAKGFLRELSLWKNGAQGNRIAENEELLRAAAYYQEQLRSKGALDYDDLLLETLRLFTDGTDREQLEKGFHYLLVDEFQDINPVQYRLIREWNKNGKELFVIGDPDQSIYGFRGSDALCFARLLEDDPNLISVTLEKNYRSTPEILSGALSVIFSNGNRERRLQAVRANGHPIRVVEAADERNEAIFIAKEINRLIGGIDMLDTEETDIRKGGSVRSFSDIAVLYRTHRQAKLLEYCLRQEGIPYVVAGREDFLLERSVRGALAFFRSVLYPEDGFWTELAKKLLFPGSCETADDSISLLTLKYGKTAARAKPVKLLEEWAEDMKAQEEEAMNKLIDMAVLYRTMEEFLDTLSFGEDGDIRRSGGRRFVADAVTLMTFHGSKGLEFPAVFLYGVRQGVVPFQTAAQTGGTEEERRLFYVGMTRAMDELIMTVSGDRSPFLSGLDGQNVRWESAKKERPAEEAVQLNLFSDFKI